MRLRRIRLDCLSFRGLSHPPGENSRDFPRCSHRGSVRPQALVKSGHTMRRPNQQEASCVRAPDLNELATRALFAAQRRNWGPKLRKQQTRLLFLDQCNSGSSTGRLCPEACSRDSIFKSVDLGRAASRVRAPGGSNDRPDRSGSVCFAQRYPLSPKRLPELPTSRALPK